MQMAGLRSLPEIANGCFVEAKYKNPVAEGQSALEKLDRRVWVETTRWRTAGSGKRTFNGSFPAMNPMSSRSRRDPSRTLMLREGQ